MHLASSIGKKVKVYGLTALLASGAIGGGVALHQQAETNRADKMTVHTYRMNARDAAFKHLYYENVIRPDSIALAEAMQAYSNIDTTKVKANYAAAQEKIERAEHNLRVAQNTGTYEDMKKKEQILNNIKISKPVTEYNDMVKLEKEIDSLDELYSRDIRECHYYSGDPSYTSERYLDLTGRFIEDDVVDYLQNK